MATGWATWWEGRKTRNAHLVSCAKMDQEVARQKAMKNKGGGSRDILAFPIGPLIVTAVLPI